MGFIFELVWRHFRVFPVWKVSLFCLACVLSCLFGRGRFYRRFACASLGAVCCVGKADFYRAFILIPRHLFDSFFPAPFLSIPCSSSSSSSSADTHCFLLLSRHDVQPPGQTMECRIWENSGLEAGFRPGLDARRGDHVVVAARLSWLVCRVLMLLIKFSSSRLGRFLLV